MGDSRTADTPVLIDQVVSRLEELIFSGHLRPGDKLREQSLAEELGVSRGPLREAIRTLEGRRLLERRPRAGVQVVGLSVDDLDQILHAREALEGMAARQAAENMTVAEINVAKQALSRHEKDPHDIGTAVITGRGEDDFHRLVAEGSRNQWLMRMLVHDIYSLLRLYRLQGARRADIAVTVAEHHVILERIFARDADGAETAMRAHLKGIRERTIARVRDASREGARRPGDSDQRTTRVAQRPKVGKRSGSR